MPQLPFNLSIIDAIIVAVFAFQIFWGAKLGFVLATFSLAGEILGIVAGIVYAPSAAKLANEQFGLIPQINQFLAQKTQIPEQMISSFNLGGLLLDAISFIVLFIVVQAGFFYLGKYIHHQVGVRRITYLSHVFFGMLIGAIKAVLEVTFALIAWNMITADPKIQEALKAAGSFSQFGQDSFLLPLFLKLIPEVSPFAKFF